MPIFCYSKTDGYFWFRIFGKGLHFKDSSKHGLNFSQRNGYRKFLKIGNWIITTLR